MSSNGSPEPATSGSGNAPTLVPSRPAGKRELVLGAIVVAAVCLVFFGTLAHPTLLWEQDQASKAARILVMLQHGELLRPFDPATTEIYQDAFFTFYYIVCAFIYKLTGGNLFGLMNHLSVVFGAIGLAGIITALRRAHGVPWYVSLPLFLSVPIVVMTFSYGNEVALSFGLFGVALAAASFGGKWARLVSPLVMVLACFARADMALICPYWLGWTLIYGLHVKNVKEALRCAVIIGIVFLIVTLIYGAVVFRGAIPKSLGFGLGHVGWILWFGNITFPFCPSLIVVGGIGTLLLLYRRRKEALLNLLLLLPLVVYFNNLYSPKYLIAMSIFYIVPVSWILLTSRAWLRGLIIASIAFWWIFSLSNFGFFGPKQGPFWYLPTADNGIPTGSYLTFYKKVHEGFYNQRYVGEIESLEKAVTQLCSARPQEPQVLWGNFNMHLLYYVTARQGHFDDYLSYFNWSSELKLPDDPRTRVFMVQPSYLWVKVLPPEGLAKFDEWMSDGRVRESIGNAGPFPWMVEVGPLVPAGSDLNLGKRILFVDQHYLGSLSMPRMEMVPAYATLAWVPRQLSGGDVSGVVYADEKFIALDHAVEGSKIYGLHFPKAYLRYTQEDTRYWRKPDR